MELLDTPNAPHRVVPTTLPCSLPSPLQLQHSPPVQPLQSHSAAPATSMQSPQQPAHGPDAAPEHPQCSPRCLQFSPLSQPCCSPPMHTLRNPSATSVQRSPSTGATPLTSLSTAPAQPPCAAPISPAALWAAAPAQGPQEDPGLRREHVNCGDTWEWGSCKWPVSPGDKDLS